MSPTTGIVSSKPRAYPQVPVDSLTAVTAPAAGQIFEIPQDAFGGIPIIEWEVVYPSAPTTPSSQLEGDDNEAFANPVILDGPYTGTTNTRRHVANKPIRFVRVNLTALAAGSFTGRITNQGRG